MNETRSFGTQCQSRKSTAMQTKRLSKEELRYYTKIVDKEKEVLLNFIKATKEHPPIRQPHYRINLLPLQTKLRKNVRKKRKTKTGKHSSNKTKVSGKTKEFDQENSGHYVSKIVVDDATHCLKLRVRSCNPKKGSKQPELKESNMAPERARSRKAKQPRRFTRDLDYLADIENNNQGGLKEMENISPEAIVETEQALKENQEAASPERTPERIMNDEIQPLSPLVTKSLKVKAEVENIDCLFTNTKSRDHLSSPASSPLPTMTTHLSPILPPDEDSSDRHATSDENDDSNYHSANEDTDDNQSDCSEEFSIVEPHEDILDDGNEQPNGETKTNAGENEKKTNIKQTDTNLKDELKKRLKANLIRKAVDNVQYDNMGGNEGDMAGSNMAGNKGDVAGSNMAGVKALPQVVSVHFYDAQTHSQQVLDPDTQITRYPTYHMVQDPKSPSTTLPYPTISSLSHMPQKPSSATLTTSRPIPPQAHLSGIPPINYPYPSYYPNATEVHKQHPAYQIPGILPQTLPPKIPNITTRGNASFNAIVPATQGRPHHPETLTKSMSTRGVVSSRASVSTEARSHHPETLTNSASSRGGSTPSASLTTDAWLHYPETLTSNGATSRRISHHPEMATHNTAIRGVAPSEADSEPKEAEDSEIIEMDMRGQKRKRFIFGAHEPPKKKVISSLLTPLCEREATRLADGIHEINMQYFPLRSLAQKAANRVSGDTDDVLKLIEQKMQLKTKIQDVEKARNLLKDIYDMVLKSKEIEDIQNFELVSHNFGVRNILNHLSLVDLYFGELGSELQSKI